MRKYFRILIHIMKLSQQSAFQFRFDYALRLFRAALEVFVITVMLKTFYNHTESIMGWNEWEALLVYGIYQTISSLVFVFAGYGITELYLNIRSGELDQHLVKPVASQFHACTYVTYITSVYRFFIGLGLIIYALSHVQAQLTWQSVGLGLMAMIAGIISYYSISFSTSIVSFWTFSDEAGEIMATITNVCRYPTDYFHKIKNYMYIFPLSFIASVPAAAMLNKSLLPAYFSPLVAVMLWMITRKLWHIGLANYQSASS